MHVSYPNAPCNLLLVPILVSVDFLHTLTRTECYCDNTLAAAAALQADTDCNMACSANSTEACGGPNRLSVYYANKAVPSGPAVAPAPSGWVSFGCWTDGSAKSLANSVQVQGGESNMTVEGCTTACSAANQSLAGLEYAGRSIFSVSATTMLPRARPTRLLSSVTCLVMVMPPSSAALVIA
jgi:hypothetical protein